MIASLQQYNVIYKYNVDSGRRQHRLKWIPIPTKLKPRWRKKGKSKRKTEVPAPSTYTCYCVFFSSHYIIQFLYSHHRYKFDSSNSEKPLKPNQMVCCRLKRIDLHGPLCLRKHKQPCCWSPGIMPPPLDVSMASSMETTSSISGRLSGLASQHFLITFARELGQHLGISGLKF